MATKEERRAELEKQMSELDNEPDEGLEEEEEVTEIIIRGKGIKPILAALEKMGMSEEEAEETVEKAEEGNKTARKKVEKAADKVKDEAPVTDEKPPSRSRYFGR
jgi:Holliday junction resolvasome RuvABC DNA-binding subunit